LKGFNLLNRIFGSDLRLEGVLLGKPDTNDHCMPSIVVSQMWVLAKNEKDPHPSEEEVSYFMKRMEFAPLEYTTTKWYSAVEHVIVSDARIYNFITSEAGVIPIDLLINKCTWERTLSNPLAAES